MSDSAAPKRRSSSFLDTLKRGSSKERSESKERRSSHSQSEVELAPLCQTTTASDSSESEPTKKDKKKDKKDKKLHGTDKNRIAAELRDMLQSRSRDTQQTAHHNNNGVPLDDAARVLGIEKKLSDLVIKVDGIATFVILDHNTLDRIEEKVDDLGGDDMECCFCLPWCQPK
jgi:hypothetical protein